MFKSLFKVSPQFGKMLTPLVANTFGVHTSAAGRKDQNAEIAERLKPERVKLLSHPLYNSVKSAQGLKIFMEHHIFAVWDFMSLLKALQTQFTNDTVPWTPKPNADIRKFLNEIALVEETDQYSLGNGDSHASHYEMYLDAMRDCGANPKAAEVLVNAIDANPGKKVTEIIKNMKDLDPTVKEFVGYNFSVIEEGKPWKICSAFTFGREDIIPDMFTTMVLHIQKNFPDTNLDKLVYYLQRHIEVDGDTHGPMALQLMSFLCGNDATKWKEVEEVAVESIRKRYVLWTGIDERIKKAGV